MWCGHNTRRKHISLPGFEEGHQFSDAEETSQCAPTKCISECVCELGHIPIWCAAFGHVLNDLLQRLKIRCLLDQVAPDVDHVD